MNAPGHNPFTLEAIHIYTHIYTYITYTHYMTFYTIKVSLDYTLKQFIRFMRYRIVSLFISTFIP